MTESARESVLRSVVNAYCPNISLLSPCRGFCEGCREEVSMVVQAMEHLTREQLEALGLLSTETAGQPTKSPVR